MCCIASHKDNICEPLPMHQHMTGIKAEHVEITTRAEVHGMSLTVEDRQRRGGPRILVCTSCVYHDSQQMLIVQGL